MDGTAVRNAALAHNLANVNTPGYRRRDVDFMQDLRSALKSGDKQALAAVKPEMKTTRQEGVRLEREFVALSENQLLYSTSAELLRRKYSGLRKVIKGN